MGEQAGPGQMAAQGGGEAWLEEVTKALGVVWPLPKEEPNREEMIHGRKAREVHNALWAIHEELPNLVRVEPEWGGENWATRKTKVFTLVFRIGDTADRVERHLSATLNHALTQSNRTNGGNQVLAWRAKTKGEKRKRAWARQAKEEQGEGDEAGPANPAHHNALKRKAKGKGKHPKDKSKGKGKGKEGKGGRGRGRGQ